MSKLTLSVDDAVIARAKRFAARRGTSVSGLVERYLDRLTSPPLPMRPEETPPVLARLRGLLAGAALEDPRRRLESKYK